MDYWGALTIPISTPANAPKRGTVVVGPGKVQQVWVFFPPGHAGKTHLRVLRYEHQVWPTNLGGWYLGDNTIITFPESFILEGFPFEFILEGYNTSTINEHTVYVRFTVLPEVVIRVPSRADLVGR